MSEIQDPQEIRLTEKETAVLGKKLARAIGDLVMMKESKKDAMKDLQTEIDKQEKVVINLANQIKSGQKELFG